MVPRATQRPDAQNIAERAADSRTPSTAYCGNVVDGRRSLNFTHKVRWDPNSAQDATRKLPSDAALRLSSLCAFRGLAAWQWQDGFPKRDSSKYYLARAQPAGM